MTTYLVRPYPVQHLLGARTAVAAARRGDPSGIMDLFRSAARALGELDPDEVDDIRRQHPRAHTGDRAAAEAALGVYDTWEGVVSVGASIQDHRRFRAFAWTVAHARYLGRPDPSVARAYARGGHLPGLGAGDGAWLAALPALVGLGPELPDELDGPVPLPTAAVADLLDVPEELRGLDPLDGSVVTAEACQAHFAVLPPAWRAVVARSLALGLLVRACQPLLRQPSTPATSSP